MKKIIISSLILLLSAALIEAFPTITYPNGGETLRVGNVITIKWLPDETDAKLNIYLIKGGLSKGMIAHNISNTGSYSWRIGTLLNGWKIVPGDDYRIKTKYIADPPLHDLSNAMFKISPALKLYKVKPIIKHPGKLGKIKPIALKPDLTVSAIGKKNSVGGRYISYTIKNLNYKQKKLKNPVYFRVRDKNKPSNKRTFTVFSWKVQLDKFNETGTYTANVPIPKHWGLIMELEIDPFSHVDESNENNNKTIVSYLLLKKAKAIIKKK